MPSSITSGKAPPLRVDSFHNQLLDRMQVIRLAGGLVPADAADAREAHGNAGFVALGAVDAVDFFFYL